MLYNVIFSVFKISLRDRFLGILLGWGNILSETKVDDNTAEVELKLRFVQPQYRVFQIYASLLFGRRALWPRV